MPAPRERSGTSRAVAAQLRAERSAHRLTVDEVVKKSGVPLSTYRKLEDATGVADSTQLKKILTAYGMALSEFFRRVESRMEEDEGGAARRVNSG